MDRKILDSLKNVLDFCSVETDREKIEKDIEMLLEEAYFQGWSDAKDDSLDEEGLCAGEEE